MSQGSPPPLDASDRLVSIELEEYRALYGLLSLRVQAIERRVPLIGASLAGIITSLHTLAGADRFFLLWSIPIALIWFVRTTISHARSLEDLLRRIESIEQSVNERSGANLLQFQSSHPSRTLFVGGRTSSESVLAVLIWSFVLLVGLAYLSAQALPMAWLFGGYLVLIGLYLLAAARSYAAYAYNQAGTG